MIPLFPCAFEACPMDGTPLLSAKIKSLCVSELNFSFSCDMV